MKPYRKNVGVVVFNAEGLVLAGERVDRAGTLQFPQGGLDKGEEPLAGALRELYEETGLRPEGEAAGELNGWLRYDFPPDVPKKLQKFQGQEQKWFFFFWDGDPDTLSLSHHSQEFSRLVWTDFAGIVEEIVPFKREVYRELYRQGQRIIMDFNQQRKGHTTEAFNPVAYFEIPVLDMARAVRFYEAVFAFKLEPETIDGNEMALFPFDARRPGITGALAKGEIYRPTRDGALVYFHTQSIDATLQRVAEAGGEVLYPKTSNGELGSVAEFSDSEGNRIALHEPPAGGR